MIQEFRPDQIEVPGVDLFFIGTFLKTPNPEEAIRHHHKERVLARNQYLTSYVREQGSFLQQLVTERGAQLKGIQEQIRNTPMFVQAVERNKTGVVDLNYRSSPPPSNNAQVDSPEPVKNTQDGVQNDGLQPNGQDVSEQTTDPTTDPPPRRAKSWTVLDKILVALLLTSSIVALGADFAVVYIYLTSNNKLPGLADSPEQAYFWAALPFIFAITLAMLPYYSPREKKLRWRFGYSVLAALLFILAWAPGFVGLFSSGLSDTQDVVDELWRGALSIGGQYDEILKWLFMAGQILSLVLASSTSWLSIFIMIEDRRVERLIRNPFYDELVARGNDLERELALANHKTANHKGIIDLLDKKAQEHGETAIGLLRAAGGRR